MITAEETLKPDDFSKRYAPDNLDGCPILELGARAWETERYLAFKTCYQAMRLVDDLVDHRKSSGIPLTGREKQDLQTAVRSWMLSPDPNGHPLTASLQQIREKFLLPEWTWQRWTRAMLFDLEHDGFATFPQYLRYAEGAAIAPGAIFMHLCGLHQDGGRFFPPKFGVRRAARPLALFAYLVHIVRDFQSDHLQNLNYFTHDLMARHGLSRAQLQAMAEGGTILPGFRALVRDYRRLAGHYRQKTRAALDAVRPCLQPPYALSLEIIYELYLQIYERINPEAETFAAAGMVPSCAEVLTRVHEVINRFPTCAGLA